ncbi:MAG: hypothetical protein AAF236_00980 [Verrucomicrobiota bacterium]
MFGCRLIARSGLLASLCLAVGCVTAPDADPGINDLERKILSTHFYYQPSSRAPKFDDESLALLMQQSAAPELDGERAEGQSAALAEALATAGDEAFANVFLAQTPEVRLAVAYDIQALWDHHELYYPLTAGHAETTIRQAALARDAPPAEASRHTFDVSE